jgi:hypothetical protein
MFAGPDQNVHAVPLILLRCTVNVEKIINGVWFTDHLSSFLPPQDKAADFFTG